MKRKTKITISIFIALSLVAIATINYNFTKMRKEEEKKAEEYRQYIDEKNKERDLKEEEIRKDEPVRLKINEVKDLISTNKNDNYKKAISICDELIKANDKEYRAYTLRGLCYAYTSGVISDNKNKAIEDINKALDIKNDYMYGLYIKGVILDNFGKYDEALTWYDKSLKIEKYPWSYYNKSIIYAKKGNKEETLNNLKKAIEIRQEFKETAKNEVAFSLIKDSELLK